MSASRKVYVKYSNGSAEVTLTLLRMAFFRAAHRWGAKRPYLPKICHTYPTMMKLGS